MIGKNEGLVLLGTVLSTPAYAIYDSKARFVVDEKVYRRKYKTHTLCVSKFFFEFSRVV